MTTFTEKILDYLQLQAEDTVDLFSIMFRADRRTAMRKARHSLVHGPPAFKKRWADLYRQRQQFYSMMNHLKREELVVKQKHGSTSMWNITDDGRERLVRLKEQQRFRKHKPTGTKAATLIIVSFDVPERERRKRDWLRANLVSFGFTMLQHSVWIGRVAIPEDFMKDLRAHQMLPYVHIFSILQRGTTIKALS